MARDLNGQPIRDDFSIASHREAQELADIVAQAIAAGATVREIGPQDLANHTLPKSRFDGQRTNGNSQRARALRGWQRRKTSTSPTP